LIVGNIKTIKMDNELYYQFLKKMKKNEDEAEMEMESEMEYPKV
jgi:hypothetical protein